MKKRLLIIIMACMVLVSFATASFAEDSTKEEKSFSLAQAVDYALKNNPQIGIAQTGLAKANVSLREATNQFKKTEDVDTVSFDVTQVKKGLYKRQAQMGVTIAEKTQLQTTEAVKFSVESSYFNLLNAEENLSIENSVLESAKENLDILSKKYDLGMVPQIDLVSAKTAYVQAEVEKKSAERAADYARMNFNKALGLPLETKVKLTDRLTSENLPSVDLNEKIASALQSRIEIIKAREQYEVSKLNADITYSWYPENTLKYQEAKYAMESSAYTLSSSQQTVELSVRKAYMDMLNAYDSLSVLDQSIEEIERLYNATKLKYESGMDISYNVSAMLNRLREIKLRKAQSMLSYNLARIQFSASYGIGLSSTGGY